MTANKYLVEPTTDLKTEFLVMAEEYRTADEVSRQTPENRIYQLAFDDFSAYLESLSNSAKGINLAPDRVPENEFWLVSNRRLLGRSRLRHRLTPALEHQGGHIGYDIRPSERQKGYGILILKLTLEKAKELGLSRVFLTCDTDNLASARIIEKNGGVLSGQAVSKKTEKPISQYWIEL